MKFSRLRLSGFKSFVEPTDLVIEPGLTGVVGPNGCGKSNLLEALRWVMGESSYKSMRASGMDDVIFSGTTQRPSRNMAEVVLTLGNEERDAPAQYNDQEVVEISRRIEREAGSAYRINGKEVRARDVQLLFADASTGARSPALVRQGQIAEIINAKPQARRLILEEAAGIMGLHTRRHEAELKLKAAEANLTRVEDVASQLETQLNSLKRQARQAQKYKQVSAEIRRLEAMGLYAAWQEAVAAASADAEALDQSTRLLAEHTRDAVQKLRTRDELGENLPGLREQEAIRAAVLQRVSLERNTLDQEEKRLEARQQELSQRLTQAVADLGREQELLGDTDGVLAKLTREDSELRALSDNDNELRAAAALALQTAAESLASAQEAADQANAQLSELKARAQALHRAADEQRQRLARIEREVVDTTARRQVLLSRMEASGDGPAMQAAVEQAVQVVTHTEAQATQAEIALRTARQLESDSRNAHDEARRKAERLQTEVRTLSNFLTSQSDGLWPALLDQVKVMPGYEAAFGAALGEDIDASSDEGAPVHWRGLPPLEPTPGLPVQATQLSQFVEAPQALQRRLTQIGLVSPSLGKVLQAQLGPGQLLVSQAGDVWRWDGFTAAADAPSTAAKRLAERNRLTQLEADMREASGLAEQAKSHFEAARLTVEQGVKAERDKREAWRAATAALDVARQALAKHERLAAERLAQTSALDEALRRVSQSAIELKEQLAQAETEVSALPPEGALSDQVAALRDEVNRSRATYAEVRARHDGLEGEARNRHNRLSAIAAEQKQWQDRAVRAHEQISQLSQRAETTRSALAELTDLPQQLADKRNKLMNTLQEAEADRRTAADLLAKAENAVRQSDQELRAAQELAATSREEHGRLDARLESSRQRQQHCEGRIAETFQCQPVDMALAAGFEVDKLEAMEIIERKLMAIREDRERLGGVNLRADDEAATVSLQLSTLIHERDELVQAIAKLRGGISSLNREGRQRLLEAFSTVNQRFSELFTTLFGGGTAELQLIESDDPLEAGLEILANPPGKKPTVLSLLSGGEQTLTAMALIFAVFLTNPSPICVLDEVDAPLDDHNVERFCNLLDAMLTRTQTRFLIITHHELTMARMHRLFGVTMMERGVSKLVSVNLAQASELAEAS